jgi:hypothetical protein
VLVSVWLYTRLYRSFTILLSVTIISLLWAVFATAAAALAPHCPGTASRAACTPHQIASQGLEGWLVPWIPLLVFIPARGAVRKARRIYTRLRIAVAQDTPVSTPVATTSKKTPRSPQGRTTPKGTRPPTRR